MARMHHIHLTRSRADQRGAALVVGLLLLLVLTLLAVSGMNTASLELIMAGNSQYRQNAFQAAETGIELAIRSGNFNPAVATETTANNVTVTGTTTDKYKSTVAAQLGGAAQPALYGSTWDSFSTFHFEIDSQGSSARGAAAQNFQGVAVIAPADSTVTPVGGPAAEVLQ